MSSNSRLVKGLGTGVLLLGAAWFGNACIFTEECACDTSYHSRKGTILDERANPVDSAIITVVRTADGKPLRAPNQRFAKKGETVIFDDGITEEFPVGELEMEIRVTATKGEKTGEELFVVTTTECRCHFGVRSGRDTVVIR